MSNQPVSDEELLKACVESCSAMRRAFNGLVRRNVEAVCRSYAIEDQSIVDRMVEQTLRALDLK
jgi:hypothetical protein